MDKNDSFSKRAIHSSGVKKDPYGALSVPVYNAVAYEFDSAEAMEQAFSGKTGDFVYSRISNPTVQAYENKVKELTGAFSVTALNSGMAAISNALMCVAYSGCNIITTRHLFGNTYSFFTSTLAAFGVEIRFCDLNDIKEVESQIDDDTCAVFLEIISNPQMDVVDLKKLSDIISKKNIPLIADTTIIPFSNFEANKFGVDIEVISSTKYLSGGATSVGGLIIDYGSFDWSQSKRLQSLEKELGIGTFTFKLKREIHRNLGAYMTPQVAYMQNLALETLQLRYDKASETTGKIASALENMPAVNKVNYPGLTSNPYYKVSKSQFGENPGAMLTFDLESQEACFNFLNNLKLIRRATNLFDNKTMALHPYTTIYGTYSKESKEQMHIYNTTIRLSVGLEDIADLLKDITQALKNKHLLYHN